MVFSYPIADQFLMDLVDSLGLVYSLPVLSVSTYYSNTNSYANSVIDLIFLDMNIV